MKERKSLSKQDLLQLLEQTEQQHARVLQSKEAELESQREKMREQDMVLQLKDQAVQELEQERDE